ncbi:pyridoxal-dependent decarboxylase [Flavobacteriaceae bacterium]|nr:pyridoxal-dependent decarboxylase [Flavobacteriaceae bacterium]
MHYWNKLSEQQLSDRIDKALSENVNFSKDHSLGYPASKLDGNVFYDNAPFLKDAPILRSFVANPNHIGCHTLGTSEKAFKGTHELEKEALSVLACDVFKAEPEQFDGYIASGGTEANIQALWVYRNYYKFNFEAKLEDIVILASEDTHYSIPKGANLLDIDLVSIPVDFETRLIQKETLEQTVRDVKQSGKKYAIVVANMATTMFGSVDDPDLYADVLNEAKMDFKLHVDGAFGGFIYPFDNEDSKLNFANPHVSSITIDAHKMLQAPYGTGVFMCRKNLIHNVLTKEAQYVEGMDLTLSGSRSGANAIAVWMILFKYGPYGWFEKISILRMRTDWLCEQLDRLGFNYYRHPKLNIVTMKSGPIPEAVAHKYDLVPKTHTGDNQWYKIVIMDHVEIQHLEAFINEFVN